MGDNGGYLGPMSAQQQANNGWLAFLAAKRRQANPPYLSQQDVATYMVRTKTGKINYAAILVRKASSEWRQTHNVAPRGPKLSAEARRQRHYDKMELTKDNRRRKAAIRNANAPQRVPAFVQ